METTTTTVHRSLPGLKVLQVYVNDMAHYEVEY